MTDTILSITFFILGINIGVIILSIYNDFLDRKDLKIDFDKTKQKENN
ncbi:hypothetical protein UFOVP610_31 [uncultured Caudovirales phage]|uniref:Uncharacterized protein n=1 Tax=uncultured Caudovirales phage TaxID=2100421 RepID=A0A6J5N277_9CAUD|nr:hypothetical protein UFOVP610_31 [uncultured Caudovirales phage]